MYEVFVFIHGEHAELIEKNQFIILKFNLNLIYIHKLLTYVLLLDWSQHFIF